MVCLDTTFLIDWLRGRETARRKYDEFRNSRNEPEKLAISIISAYELEKGARLSKKPTDLKIVTDLLSELVILELDKSSVEVASQIYLDLSRRGKLVGEFDIIIAATCIVGNHALVTNDNDFDQIRGLTKLPY